MSKDILGKSRVKDDDGEGWTVINRSKPRQKKDKTINQDRDVKREGSMDPAVYQNQSYHQSQTHRNYQGNQPSQSQNGQQGQTYGGQVSTNFQDWKEITFRRPPKPVKELKQRSQIASSQQRHNAKIDREIDAGDPSVLKKVAPQMSKRMVDYRMAKNLTQAQFAMQTNLPVGTIHDYENGSAIHEIRTTQMINTYMARNPVAPK